MTAHRPELRSALAELGKDASGHIEVSVPPNGVLHRDFNIPRGRAAVATADSVASAAPAGIPIRRGSARLSGAARVTLDDRADALDQVTVYGKARRRQNDITGFLDRRTHGIGRFYTRADEAHRRHPHQRSGTTK